jgi:hypothetical protein
VSNERAVAAVTATLKNMIFRALSADADLAGTEVTARPPDRARQGGVAGSQINLFLYRTSIDPAWRNQDPPGLRPGEAGEPPLPLVLSYLLTAYGENDDEVLSHRLLGVGLRVLNDRPLLAPADIAAALPGSELENQVERVRITPHPIPLDEISRMWATFQTGYRISVSYDVAVVLIDSARPVRAPLPVLARSAGDIGPSVLGELLPVLELASAPGGRPAALPGEEVTLLGRRLDRVDRISVSGLRLGQPVLLTPSTVSERALTVQLPEAPALPAGTVAVAVVASPALATTTPGTTLMSNRVPVGLAPTITGSLPLAATLTNGVAALRLGCTPPVEPGQTVALVVGDKVVPGVPGASGTAPRSELDFALTNFAAGSYTLRLRVDGHDSIPVTTDLLAFDDTQRLVLS